LICPSDNSSICPDRKYQLVVWQAALAQVINYWKYPSFGYGNSQYSAWTYGVQSFDFSKHQFLWVVLTLPINQLMVITQ
jgi:hypothetical protein